MLNVYIVPTLVLILSPHLRCLVMLGTRDTTSDICVVLVIFKIVVKSPVLPNFAMPPVNLN